MERLTKQKKLLTTEDIASMYSRLESIEDIIGLTYDLSRLKELVEATNNDGQYILWEPAEGLLSLYYIAGVYIHNGEIRYVLRGSCGALEPVVNHHAIKAILTGEAAEKALEDMNG